MLLALFNLAKKEPVITLFLSLCRTGPQNSSNIVYNNHTFHPSFSPLEGEQCRGVLKTGAVSQLQVGDQGVFSKKHTSIMLGAFASIFSAHHSAVAIDGDTPPILFGETQIRYEGAKNDAFPLRSDGISQAIRIGLEYRITDRLTFLAEGEGVYAVLDNYNDGTGNNPLRPVIPNPETLELNRLQLQAKLSDETYLTIGRQVLAFDDQRFIGQARFRQNNQTFDAVHFTHRFGAHATFQAGYINRVNRPLGGDNINGRFKGGSYYLNAGVQTPIGRIGAFHYALDLTTGLAAVPNNRFSSQTTGIRLDSRWHKDFWGLDINASYAHQKDYAENPIDYSADYKLAGFRAYAGATRFGFQYESLGAGNGQSFQTILGTRRKFQGLADVFLLTPQNGVDDYSVFFELEFANFGVLSGLTAFVRQHWFRAERGDSSYGSETDFVIKTGFWGAEWQAGIATYRANSFAADTQRAFVNVTSRF